MTYHYVWLAWASAFLVPWLALYLTGRRLRPVMWRVSLATAVFGLTEPIWELGQSEREIRKLIQAIKDGISGVAIKDELLALETRQAELKRQLQEPEAAPLLHPSMSDLYREKVTGLCHALEGDERSLAGAREAIRGLIDEMSLEPDGDQLRIILKGNLAGMPRLAQENNKPSETDDLLDHIQLVAGAGFELGGGFRALSERAMELAVPTRPGVSCCAATKKRRRTATYCRLSGTLPHGDSVGFQQRLAIPKGCGRTG